MATGRMQDERAEIQQAAESDRHALLRTLREAEARQESDRSEARREAEDYRVRMPQRFLCAEHLQDEEQAAMRKNLEDLERRHQADIADREARATAEMKVLSARIQATATSEKHPGYRGHCRAGSCCRSTRGRRSARRQGANTTR